MCRRAQARRHRGRVPAQLDALPPWEGRRSRAQRGVAAARLSGTAPATQQPHPTAVSREPAGRHDEGDHRAPATLHPLRPPGVQGSRAPGGRACRGPRAAGRAGVPGRRACRGCRVCPRHAGLEAWVGPSMPAPERRMSPALPLHGHSPTADAARTANVGPERLAICSSVDSFRRIHCRCPRPRPSRAHALCMPSGIWPACRAVRLVQARHLATRRRSSSTSPMRC